MPYPLSTRESVIRKLLTQRTVTPDGCWLWTGGVVRRYGQCKAFRKSWRVHRLAYHIWVAPLPDTRWVLHRCDQPLCFNPDHLFPGDHRLNTDDKLAKRRQAKGQQINGKLSPTQVREIRLRRSIGWSLGQLAKKYHISKGSVSSIVKRLTWKHLN